MIEQIHIKNFQSHKESELDFLPGVNIIVGTSDSGKTAIIRALKWLVKNRPSGGAYRSNWGGDTEVTVKVDDKEITRRRTKNKNEYELPGGMVLKALKTGIPEEVSTILQIEDINLQQQFDNSFLLSATSGEVAEHFNKIAKFEKVGQTSQKIRIQLLQHNRSLENQKERIVELRDDLKAYSYIPEYEKLLKGLEAILSRFKGKKSDLDALYSLKEKLLYIQRKQQKLKDLIGLESKVAAAEKKIEKREEINLDLSEITKIGKQISSLNKRGKRYRGLIKLETKTNNLITLQHKTKDLQKVTSGLNADINDFDRMQRNITSKKERISKLSKKYKEEFPDICPLCGSRIK